MTYQAATQFAQSWGLLLLCALFAAACAYALWPGNRTKFEEASRAPLQED
jgi:cytochrome c oxidase cbb3-type subunit 4